MSTSLELRQDRHALVLEMRTLSNKTDAASASRWKELDAKQDSLRVQIENSERTSLLETELAQVRNVERPNISTEHHAANGASAIRSSDSYKADFNTYLRTGRTSAQMEEVRALGAASGADGATLVPQGFENELEIKLKAFAGMIRLCRTITTATGNPLPWPKMDDTGNVGEFLAESAVISNADPVFSAITFGANLASSKQVLVPVQLEQDAAFDMSSLLSDAFTIRLGRLLNSQYTVGTANPITGLVTALVAAGGRSVLAVGANSNSGAAGDTDLNSIGTDDLIALTQKVDPAFRANPKRCFFAANQATWDKLRNLKDKYGRPIWQTSLASGVPDSVMGYGYDYNQDLALIGAGQIPVVFGNWDHAVIRNVLGFTLVRYNELYMTNHQRGYQAFLRSDFKLLEAAAFSYLQTPLS